MFYYALCQPGAEAWLRSEAAWARPDLHPSFAKPGFVTFKGPEGPPPRLLFARVAGTFSAKGGVEAWAEAARAHEADGGLSHLSWPALPRAEGRPAPAGTRVLDGVVIDETQVWWGVRTVTPWTWGWPGGLPALDLPAGAPSRAWLKLEESLLWSGWDPAPGTVAVELGSAPGGASWALLNRGVRVTGVDVAAMDPRCLTHPAYTHVAGSVRDLRKKQLPAAPEVLFCDLGLRPLEAVPQIRHLCRILPSLRRLYYTLKLGDGLDFRALDGWFAALRALGFELHSTHLPSHRQELLVAGFR